MIQSTFPALVSGPAAVHVSRCGPALAQPSLAQPPGQVGFSWSVLEIAALPQKTLQLVSVEGITPFLPKSSLPENNQLGLREMGGKENSWKMQGENEAEAPLGLMAEARAVSSPGAKSSKILLIERPLFQRLLLSPSPGPISLITVTLAAKPRCDFRNLFPHSAPGRPANSHS